MPNTKNSTSSPETLASKIIVRGIHLELTEAIRAAATEKTSRLLRHNDHIIRVRIDLEHDHAKGDPVSYVAKGHVEIAGPDLIASVTSDDAYKSLDLLVDKLDRMIRERSRHRADRRNNRPEGEEFRDLLAPAPAE
ncbi:MAG: ribosome-associated translation inhibitor RaiA [Verrucomicrobia bacterium]|nr:ribosome-associated translation inhibitor RaiA [Verrucomicrobiota bacterium]